MPDNLSKKHFLTLTGGILAALNLSVYALVYQYEPFNPLINRLILNGLTVATAGFAAIVLTLIVDCFQPEEPPRRMWGAFSGAMWCWTIGEVIWAWYNLTVLEVPDFSGADIFWFIGYVFLTASILNQFKLIYFGQMSALYSAATVIWTFSIMLTTMILAITGSTDILIDFMGVFYPIADFFVAATALILVITFRRGTLAYPWLSLFAFVVADSLYIWATSSDIYNYEMSGSITNLMVDGAYQLAYIILSWGVFQQLLLLKFGANFQSTDAPPPGK